MRASVRRAWVEFGRMKQNAVSSAVSGVLFPIVTILLLIRVCVTGNLASKVGTFAARPKHWGANTNLSGCEWFRCERWAYSETDEGADGM